MSDVLARVALWPLATVSRVTPVPAALAVRWLFRVGGARTAAALAVGAPTDVELRRNLPDGRSGPERFDAYLPAPDGSGSASRSLPLVVWVHGGGFVGGAKEELEGYLRRVAAAGFVVIAPSYGLAPGTRYPMPVRQVASVLAAAVAMAPELGADPERVVLAGDSAGAQLAAQVATLIVDPDRAAALEVATPVAPSALRGTILCCGVYDLAGLATAAAASPIGPLVDAVAWAYTGRRDYRDDARFVQATSIAELVDDRFPPTFLTVGDADPLRAQTEELATALSRAGVPLATVLHPATDGPGLGHEYQFELERPEARQALAQLLAFLAERTALR